MAENEKEAPGKGELDSDEQERLGFEREMAGESELDPELDGSPGAFAGDAGGSDGDLEAEAAERERPEKPGKPEKPEKPEKAEKAGGKSDKAEEASGGDAPLEGDDDAGDGDEGGSEDEDDGAGEIDWRGRAERAEAELKRMEYREQKFTGRQGQLHQENDRLARIVSERDREIDALRKKVSESSPAMSDFLQGEDFKAIRETDPVHARFMELMAKKVDDLGRSAPAPAPAPAPAQSEDFLDQLRMERFERGLDDLMPGGAAMKNSDEFQAWYANALPGNPRLSSLASTWDPVDGYQILRAYLQANPQAANGARPADPAPAAPAAAPAPAADPAPAAPAAAPRADVNARGTGLGARGIRPESGRSGRAQGRKPRRKTLDEMTEAEAFEYEMRRQDADFA